MAILLLCGALVTEQAHAVDGGPGGGEPIEPPDEPPPPDPPVREPALFDWSMPKRFGIDTNGDFMTDYFTPSDFCTADDAASCARYPATSSVPIAPSSWHVDLDACNSTYGDPAGATFTWQLVAGSGVISGGPGCNTFDLTVPAEGKYTLKLTVSSTAGTASVTKDIVVQDWLIVSLGDSYGSGEGNPDVPAQHDWAGFISAGAKWEDRRCHRSADAGSARAAKWLENADPHTSVTFIHVACSGAEAKAGLLEAYGGVNTTWEAKNMAPLDPQLTQARELVGGREVDAVYISIGGNDSNFAKIVMSCIALNPCNPRYVGFPDIPLPDLTLAAICLGIGAVVPQPAGIIAGTVCATALSSILAAFAGQTAENWFKDGLRGTATEGDLKNYRLTGIYDQLASALVATGPGPNGEPYFGLPASHSNRVFVSEYVDATQDDEGDYCPKGDLLKPFNDIRIPGLGHDEYQWIDLEVEHKLNETIAFNTQRNGWNLVDGIHDRFATHGICADDTYFRGLLAETFWLQDDMNATAHPNYNGHGVYRDRILDKLLPSLYPGAGGESLDVRHITDVVTWINGHAPRSPEQVPVADAGGPYTVAEGSTVPATNGSYDDGALTYAWSSSNDNIATVAPPSTATPTISGVDDGQATLTLGVSDDADADAEATDTAAVTVTNVAPIVSAVSAPISPVAVGTTITASSSYSDPGADDHTVTWSWGDGTPATTANRGVNADGAISATHKYTASGLYPVSVTVDDHDGGVTTQTFEYVVVYDPSNGFVTGGGTIDSPAGALANDPTAGGPASFAFVAKFQKGATVPAGNTQFRFHAADFALTSTSYEWLVVSGARAQYKGAATVNGTPGYGFLLTAVDGNLLATSTADQLRLKVWSLADGSIVYDNQLGAADNATPTSAITGGQITISSSK